ncbi:MAG: hypothetical protein MUE73_02490 [Planctomycetes bacterium]|jgi:hypothetical protein|nr:hypothetical protein [Planctomycetota bacterium]
MSGEAGFSLTRERYTAGNRAKTGYRSVNFRFMVATRVRRVDVDWLAEPRAPGPPPLPAPVVVPAASPPRPGRLARLWRLLRGSG